MRWLLFALALAGWPAIGPALAVEHVGTPADYLGWLPRLRPGEVLRLEPGTYAGGLPIHSMHGEPGRPIVIAGPPGPLPAVFIARSGANTVSIKDSSHVSIRGVHLDGLGLPVDAVKLEGTARFAHDITLEGLVISGFGHDQGIVGISTQAPAWNWVVRNNVIIGAGTGMYLGGSDGSRPFVNGLIEGNLVVGTIGYNVQIKHQRERTPVQGMPTAPGRTIIRHNVFSKADNAAGGEFARPNVLVGHFPPHGAGAADEYVIYGNFFYENPVEALFQGEGNVAFYNNVLVNMHGDAIHVQPQNGKPRKIRIFHNTILARDIGISLQGADETARQLVARNLVVAARPLVGRDDGNVVGSPERASEIFRAPALPPGAGLDLAPRRSRPQPLPEVDASDLPAAGLDFESRPRAASDVGAYGSDSKQPRWPLQLKRKPATTRLEKQ